MHKGDFYAFISANHPAIPNHGGISRNPGLRGLRHRRPDDRPHHRGNQLAAIEGHHPIKLATTQREVNYVDATRVPARFGAIHSRRSGNRVRYSQKPECLRVDGRGYDPHLARPARHHRSRYRSELSFAPSNRTHVADRRHSRHHLCHLRRRALFRLRLLTTNRPKSNLGSVSIYLDISRCSGMYWLVLCGSKPDSSHHCSSSRKPLPIPHSRSPRRQRDQSLPNRPRSGLWHPGGVTSQRSSLRR